MQLKKNLVKKRKIDVLSVGIKKSMDSSNPEMKLDKESAIELIEMAGGEYRKIRDLDVYYFGLVGEKEKFLILDNEMKIYLASIEDASMRKSPTIREMVSFGNIRKILNDKDIVLTQREQTVDALYGEIFEKIDLSFREEDLDELVMDGRDAFERRDHKAIVDVLGFFFELLGYEDFSIRFHPDFYKVYGKVSAARTDEKMIEPVVIFDESNFLLYFYPGKINPEKKDGIEHLLKNEEVKEEIAENEEVFFRLKSICIEK